MGGTKVSIVNSGEPHCVIFVENVESENIDRYGKTLPKIRSFFLTASMSIWSK
jgi:hypothetical protein